MAIVIQRFMNLFFKYFYSRKKFFVIFLLFFIIIPLIWPTISWAVGRPFGGVKLYHIWCNCSGNVLIFYTPVKPETMPLTLSYRPGSSRLYSYYQIFRNGAWLLGTTVGPDACVYGSKCQHTIFTELIGIVGTSK